MKIPYVNINRQYKDENKKLIKIIDNVLRSGNWVGGPEIEKFEKNIFSKSMNIYTGRSLLKRILNDSKDDYIVGPEIYIYNLKRKKFYKKIVMIRVRDFKKL